MERLWVGDVLVVGAGASGIIIAQRLVDLGLTVTVVERGLVGGEQSNHSHGYMHRGHIYLTPSAELVRNLSHGADRWRAEMDAVGIAAINDASSLLFTNAYESDVASAAWSRAGLTFTEEPAAPAGIRHVGLSRAFATREATFDFTHWLAVRSEALASRPGVTFIQADVVRLERDSTTVSGAVVSVGNESVRLASSFVVLCAGTGNLGLASTITRLRGNALNRSSPMLVLRGAELPSLSAVFHGHETHGLFIATRPVPGAQVWLVSNYVSYAGEATTSTAIRLWLRDIRSTLSERTIGLEDRANTWGYYCAPKGELRNIRTSINGHSVQSYGLDNLLVASPTKLTLAHLLGDLVVEAVARRVRHSPRQVDAVGLASPLAVAPERWKAAPLEPLDSLLEL